MAFNYERFKQAYRRAARIRGIDPAAEEDNEHAAKVKSQLVVATRYATKETSFLIALVNAEIRRDLHHSRERELVRAAAARQVEQAKRGLKWEEGRGLLTEDRKAIDGLLLAKAESKEWWQALRRDDWKSGGDGSTTERKAFTTIRQAIDDEDSSEPEHGRKPDMIEALDAMNEVFDEMHTESPAPIWTHKQSKEILRTNHV